MAYKTESASSLMEWFAAKTDRCHAWFDLACVSVFQPVILWDMARALIHRHVNPAKTGGKLLNHACWGFLGGTKGVHCQIWSYVCSVSTASIVVGVCVCVLLFSFFFFSILLAHVQCVCVKTSLYSET